MNPKELADVLRGVAAMPMHNGNSDADAMRQAADLLATARAEWRVSSEGEEAFGGVDGQTARMLRDFLVTRGEVDVTCESRHVIETPWVAEDGAP